MQETSEDNKSHIEDQKQRSLQQPVLLPRSPGLCVSGHMVRAIFFVSDTSLRRSGRAPYRDEATAVVRIGLPVLIGAQNIFHLEQTINERKTET